MEGDRSAGLFFHGVFGPGVLPTSGERRVEVQAQRCELKGGTSRRPSESHSVSLEVRRQIAAGKVRWGLWHARVIGKDLAPVEGNPSLGSLVVVVEFGRDRRRVQVGADLTYHPCFPRYVSRDALSDVLDADAEVADLFGTVRVSAAERRISRFGVGRRML